jgi:hypothetical protein
MLFIVYVLYSFNNKKKKLLFILLKWKKIKEKEVE